MIREEMSRQVAIDCQAAADPIQYWGELIGTMAAYMQAHLGGQIAGDLLSGLAEIAHNSVHDETESAH